MHATGAFLDQFEVSFARVEPEIVEGECCGLKLVDCNKTFTAHSGVDPSIGADYAVRVFGADVPAALSLHESIVRDGGGVVPLRFERAARSFVAHCRVDDGVIEIILVDVTSYQTEGEFTRLREQAYRSFIEHLPMIAFLRVISPQPVSLFTAGSFREITGYGPERGSSSEVWMELVHADDHERVIAAAERLYSGGNREQELEYRIVRADGEIRWVRSYDRQFTSDDGKLQLVQGLILDITDERIHQEELQRANDHIQEQNRMLARLARTDPLTGLLNRRAMQEQLQREIRMIGRGRRVFSILLLDLDHFKAVNDKYGHRAGDRVLLNLASVLSEQVRGSDIQSRWGGEEFMVLFSGTGIADARRVSEKLLDWFSSHSTVLDDDEIFVTFTGGLVEARDGDTVDTLFARADRALYQGKADGRNRIVVDSTIKP